MRFPISEETVIRWPGPPPTTSDVVIIGGGVIGVCTAIFLARAGVRAVMLEKGRIAGEQSSRNWGWIRQQGRDPHELPLVIEAIRHWRSFSRETNEGFGLASGGVTYLARRDADLERFAAWVPHAQAHRVDTRVLSAADARKLVPGLDARIAGALFTSSDLRAEPALAVPALAGIAERSGAFLVESCAVRALDVSAGRVAGVFTEAGHIRAPEVVLAGGAWSALFLARHGVFLPQLSVRASVAATHRLPEISQTCVSDRKVALRPRIDGGCTIAAGSSHELFLGPHALRSTKHYVTQLKSDPFGTRILPAAPPHYPDSWRTRTDWDEDGQSPFEDNRVLNPAPNLRKLTGVARSIGALFPHLGPVRLKTAWAGMIDTMPDVVPVIDRVPDLPGLTLGTGFSGHGFGIGPGAGRVLADLACGHPVDVDLRRFRFSRFSDGSQMDLGPAL